MHGHYLNGVGAGLVVAALFPHVVWQLALGQGAGAQVHRGPVRAQHGHVAPRKAFFVGAGQVVGYGKCLFAQGGQLDDDGGLPLAPAAHGFEQGDAVVIHLVRRQQVRRNEAGGVQYLAGVAVVDLQDGGAALCLNAHALEAELLASRPFINALRIIKKHQQAVGGGVHHLGDKLEPFGCEVVAFVNHHRLVLAARYLAALHRADDVVYQFFRKSGALGRQGLARVFELVIAPFVKVAHMHLAAQALGLHHAVQLDAQRLVKAEDEDGLAAGCAGLGQVLGTVAQDHGFARACHAVDHAMPIAQAAGQLLLLDVHHPHDVWQLGLI